jgi:hypothetical protein
MRWDTSFITDDVNRVTTFDIFEEIHVLLDLRQGGLRRAVKRAGPGIKAVFATTQWIDARCFQHALQLHAILSLSTVALGVKVISLSLVEGTR